MITGGQLQFEDASDAIFARAAEVGCWPEWVRGNWHCKCRDVFHGWSHDCPVITLNGLRVFLLEKERVEP
jgi:hypothetical protein